MLYSGKLKGQAGRCPYGIMLLKCECNPPEDDGKLQYKWVSSQIASFEADSEQYIGTDMPTDRVSE